MSKDPIVSGFRWSGVSAGIRKKKGHPDLALLIADEAVPCAAVFTQSDAAAAPVRLSKKTAKSGMARAVLMNAGCANACTGNEGDDAARRMAAALEGQGVSADETLIASTGVIGLLLPIDKVERHAPAAFEEVRPEGIRDFARAIMTTDTVEKVASRSGLVAGKRVNLAGVSKGAGMIMPNMATMLACVVSDVAIAPDALQSLLKEACDDSFNAITVDGDTSTNDTVYALASQKAGNPTITQEDSPGYAEFRQLLRELCLDLAKAIVGDGEGATKLIEVRVSGAQSKDEADTIARRIANSPLVKTACHAGDPNWGRIIAAAGACGFNLDIAAMELLCAGVPVMKAGQGTGVEAETQAAERMKEREWSIELRLGRGSAERSIYTCDFSADYVSINADYRS